MNVIASCVLYHHTHTQEDITQALSFNVTDIEGSVLLSCADMLVLGLVLTSEKLDKSSLGMPNLLSANLTGLMCLPSTRRSKETALTNQSTSIHDQTHTTWHIFIPKKIP